MSKYTILSCICKMSKKEETTNSYTVFSVLLCVLLLSLILSMYYRLHFQNNTTDLGRVQRLNGSKRFKHTDHGIKTSHFTFGFKISSLGGVGRISTYIFYL